MLIASSISRFPFSLTQLGGIVKPNDGECHLDERGLYTESIYQDYPSISQVNQKVQDNHVNIIFAVTAGFYDIYKQLEPLVEGSSTGMLMNDSSNVVELIKGEYAKITSSVELKDNATSNIRVSYYSTCMGVKREETSICKGLKVGSTVNYDVILEVTSCPRKPSDYNQTIQIYPVGLNDALIIDLEIICECDCEKPWNEEKNSLKCSGGNGTYECGICSCYGNRYGKDCECDAKESDTARDDAACFKDPKDAKVCSGRGTCRCGVCECTLKNPEERVYGQFCECDNFSCDRADGKICSGPDHGVCDCGVCKCLPGWSGDSCNCRNSNETCIAPNSNTICSGHGDCYCGECKCHEHDDGHYTGQYCDECPTCKTQCEALKDCVRCIAFGTGPYDKDECLSRCDFMPTMVDQLNVRQSDTHCIFIDEDDCKFQFKYSSFEDDPSRTIVHVQKTKDCPTPVNIFAIVLGVILGIVMVGLALLLIWKLLTTIHDRREFARFEKERMLAKWDTVSCSLAFSSFFRSLIFFFLSLSHFLLSFSPSVSSFFSPSFFFSY